ncbi:bifunctional protein FolD [Luminiphilus syltensis NOR5-1B]|uniref:Bifunctional protein FolD n=1 Tax=Luminiphilus syltensis NOR5-1B TaxID=565045 RepID=B8KY45_9GAMM|nr:bifunctional methylenetetrahydrofolate dehydrogenase/methenyltetrahydrofolate cyclohydrolase FolD [Luminiphilus syltensis]EED34327.1 bifunctional protein FolD [Luminiphilus syltensis NOR5-1B]
MQLIDGKLKAAEILEQVKAGVEGQVKADGARPGLTVVLVGEDPASQVYVRNKEKRAEEAGFNGQLIRLPSTTSESDLLAVIDKLNTDKSVHGILVQLPLPEQINEQAVIGAIAPEKDVDGFHEVNGGRLLNGDSRAMVPCTPLGCLHLIETVIPDLKGMHAVIIGRSNIVGKPLSMLLLQKSCTVTITHSKTRDLPNVCAGADILIAAVGVPELVKADWVKPGAVVIDVGINRVARDGKQVLVGDVDFDAVRDIASAITPVPGGVGPMTIACLLSNTLAASR